MSLKSVLGGVAGVLLLIAPALAQMPAAGPPVAGPPLGNMGAGWWRGDSLWWLIDEMIDREAELGLSPAQVERLERLPVDILREAIRKQADLAIAELDLAALLARDPMDVATPPLDMPRVESAARQVEQIRADLQLASVRGLEAARAQLTAEQRAKLATLLEQDDPSPVGRAPGPGAPGGPAGHPGRPGGHERPRFEPHRGAFPGIHHRPFVGAGPWFAWNLYGYPGFGFPYVPPPPFEPPSVYIELPPAPPVSYWYYCPSAGAYYPSVQSCDEPWVPVPAR
jgi:hypothetical protein